MHAARRCGFICVELRRRMWCCRAPSEGAKPATLDHHNLHGETVFDERKPASDFQLPTKSVGTY